MSLRSSWHLFALGLIAAGVVVAGVLELGTPTSSARTSRQVVTAARGVVQSTVSGSGNVQPGINVEANFQTSGTLAHVYIKDGDHVVKGQLIATLDPTAAESSLAQAQESLTAAQDNLTNAQDATVTQTTSAAVGATTTEYAAFHPVTTTATSTTTTPTTTTPAAPTAGTGTTTTETTTTGPTTTTTQTTPSSGRSGTTGHDQLERRQLRRDADPQPARCARQARHERDGVGDHPPGAGGDAAQ